MTPRETKSKKVNGEEEGRDDNASLFAAVDNENHSKLQKAAFSIVTSIHLEDPNGNLTIFGKQHAYQSGTPVEDVDRKPPAIARVSSNRTNEVADKSASKHNNQVLQNDGPEGTAGGTFVATSQLASSSRALASAARAHTKTALAHGLHTGSEKQQTKWSSGPGAEYVRSRAPGLSRTSYLILMGRQPRGNRSSLADESVKYPGEEYILEEAVTVVIPPLEAHSIAVIEEPALSREAKDVKRSQNIRCLVLIAVICIVTILAFGLGIGLSVNREESRTNWSASSTTTSSFDPISLNCTVVNSQSNPHVISQCHCHNNISKVADDIVARYNELTVTFIDTVEMHPNVQENLASCQFQNQALLWLASGAGSPFTDVNLRQRYVLALLFISWGGPQWVGRDGWLSSGDECTWAGVSCGRLNQVVGLDLSNIQAKGNLGSDFVLLTDLAAISIDQNGMYGSLPSTWSNLTDLSSLILDHNELTGTLPSELTDLSNLRELDVSRNMLQGTLPTWIGQLTNVRSLTLSNNTFGPHTIPTEIGLLTKLTDLELDTIGLRGTLPTELFQLGMQLNMLSVRSNSLSGTIPNSVGNLGTTVGALLLAQNNLTGTIPSEISHCTGLVVLDLAGNHLHGTIPSSFAVLTSLMALHLDGNEWSGTFPLGLCHVVRPTLCTTSRLHCDCCDCKANTT